jgi:hypothetical protein
MSRCGCFGSCQQRDPAPFEDAFRSHYELRRPPRGPENRAAAIHMAISMFDREELAVALAARRPKLGGHVATVDLQPGLESACRSPDDRPIVRSGAVRLNSSRA